MITAGKLKASPFGRGKARIDLGRAYRRMDPADQMATLNQWMRQLRQAHAEAEAEHRRRLAAEDARNADAIRVRA